MFGVLTETGFEINSIFLYDNHNISDDLPEELLELFPIVNVPVPSDPITASFVVDKTIELDLYFGILLLIQNFHVVYI